MNFFDRTNDVFAGVNTLRLFLAFAGVVATCCLVIAIVIMVMR